MKLKSINLLKNSIFNKIKFDLFDLNLYLLNFIIQIMLFILKLDKYKLKFIKSNLIKLSILFFNKYI